MKSSKLISLLAATLFCAAVAYGQQRVMSDNVPQEVLSAFRAKFPDASNVSWWRGPNSNYEAKFTLATGDERAEFDGNGIWVETESPIAKATLPANVTRAVITKNPRCKISNAKEVQTVGHGMMYEVACGTGMGEADFRVTPDGKKVEPKAPSK